MIHHELKLGPHLRVVIAIIDIDSPMLFYKYEHGKIWWTQDPGVASGWPKEKRAQDFAKEMCDGEHDDRLEEWARGHEYRAVKVSSLRTYELEVI